MFGRSFLHGLVYRGDEDRGAVSNEELRLKRGFHFLLKKPFDFVVIAYNQCLESFLKKNRGISLSLSTIGSFFLHRRKPKKLEWFFLDEFRTKDFEAWFFSFPVPQCPFQIIDVKSEWKMAKISTIVVNKNEGINGQCLKKERKKKIQSILRTIVPPREPCRSTSLRNG